jgi:dihydrofolate reductase (trimethoprim resistance protein)
MKMSLIAARSKNGVIGNGPDIPWFAKGEQLIFKALTYNQWLLLGRKTYESMGLLANRKYAVVSRSGIEIDGPNVRAYKSIEEALGDLEKITDHIVVSGGGQIYKELIERADTLHVSVVDKVVDGDVLFPKIPSCFDLVFEQSFDSNVNYVYQIWQKANKAAHPSR